MAENQMNDNNTCVVCFKTVVYYSIGECDHPVCFECSTRMRVLCLQNECPICRQDLSKVVFTDTVLPYKELRNCVFSDRLFERQFKIGFCSEQIKQAYETLLENRCKLCENIPPFRTFSQLSDHMRKVHERYYCDLCVKHLKIFTSERKCYTRQELAHHRRKGDVDDTSHRGHPLCEFCEERFMDADELYRHLRKEHLYCHLCDADGKNLYYASHQALAHHFRTDHFLCEEGDCAGNHLTAVFRTEIDLKAHKATVHGKGLTRGAARQARTLELQFNITPHSAQLVHRPLRERERERRPEEAEAAAPPPPRDIDTRSDAQFPRLAAAAPCPRLAPAHTRVCYGADGLTRNEKNFPALGGGGGGGGGAAQGSDAGPRDPRAGSAPPRPAAPPAAAVLRNSKPSVSISVHSQPASASNFRLTANSGRVALRRRDQPFPALGEPAAQPTPTPKVGTVSSPEMQALKSAGGASGGGGGGGAGGGGPRRGAGAEAFPALGSPAPPPASWITVSKDKGKKVAKPEPAAAAREPAFNPVADFPTLPVNNRPKNKKGATPSPPAAAPRPAPAPARPAPAPAPAPAPSKKDKKKHNSAIKNDDMEPAVPVPSYVNGYDKFTSKQIKEAYNAAITEEDKAPQPDKKIATVRSEESTTSRPRHGNGHGNGNGDFALRAHDYPPLSARSEPPPPPALAYSQLKLNKKDKQQQKSIPNGVGQSMKGCGLTFTSSSGERYPAAPHAYVPPPDFARRNRALAAAFADALAPSAIHDFKEASRAYRTDQIDAEDFYQHCKRALGDSFDTLFPDLVALLPDISKQQELVVGRDVASKLEVCETCGQLTAPADSAAHRTAHWPPLTH